MNAHRALGGCVASLLTVSVALAQPTMPSRLSLEHLEKRAAGLIPSREQLRYQEIPWVHDLAEAQKLAARGVDLDGADYDGRTALHLAASEGHAHVVEYLIAEGVKLSAVDRWGGTPLSDARRNDQELVITLLEAALAEHRTVPPPSAMTLTDFSPA